MKFWFLLFSVLIMSANGSSSDQVGQSTDLKIEILIAANNLWPEFAPLLSATAIDYGLNLQIQTGQTTEPANLDTVFEELSDHQSKFKVIILSENRSGLPPELIPQFEGNGILFESQDATVLTPFAQLTIALGLYAIGNCEQAVPILEEAQITALQTTIDAGSFLREVYFYTGNCQIILEDFEKAKVSFENLYSMIVRSSPITPDSVKINLAWVYIHLGKLNEGQVLIEPMLERHSSCLQNDVCVPSELQDIVKLLTHRSQLYMLLGKYDLGASDLTTAIELEPGKRDLYILRGQMYLNLYEWDKSLNDFNTAIELAPEYANSYFQRGVLYYSVLQTGQELRTEALADFRHYLELAPEGEHTDQAREYADKIEAELAALSE